MSSTNPLLPMGISIDKLTRHVLEHMADGVVITDEDANIIYVNRAYCAITGYSAEDAIGHKSNLIRSYHHDNVFYDNLWHQLRTIGKWEGEIWSRRKNGELFPEWLSIHAVRNDKGDVLNYVGMMTDISDKKALDERLQKLAHYDVLTGLPSKRLLRETLSLSLTTCKRKAGVLFIDLDHFKHINEVYGHVVGDMLLKMVATRLSDFLGNNHQLARMGGDEFIVSMIDLEQEQELAILAQGLIHCLSHPFKLNDKEVLLSPTIGISVYPEDGVDADSLITHAHTAMYEAKKEGRGTYKFFTSALNTRAAYLLELILNLRQAIIAKDFEVVFQPFFDAQSRKVTGAEALVRWPSKDKSPAEFIPVAEETNLIHELGKIVLEMVCGHIQTWLKEGKPVVPISINISALQIADPSFATYVASILAKYGVPPNLIYLELTESTIMGGSEIPLKNMKELADLGISWAIDDFGTGHSNLAYLRKMPLRKLKVDKSFVNHIPANQEDTAITATVIGLAKLLGLSVVAEGVETEDQAQYLRTHDCNELQGYLLAKPEPAESFAKRLL